MSLLIKNGRIITADADYVADLFIDGELIHTIGKNLPVNADEIIDATGKLVFPGGIDPHVHLDMPFMGTFSSDNYETGNAVAETNLTCNKNPGTFGNIPQNKAMIAYLLNPFPKLYCPSCLYKSSAFKFCLRMK